MKQFENFINGASIGDPLVHTAGQDFYLDPTNGNDGNTGLSPVQAFKTLPVAYSALTANSGDRLHYIPGTSSINLTATFTWAKSYTHFWGSTAPSPISNRARIFQATGAGQAVCFTISGTGCTFKNLEIFQGVAVASALVAVNITGGRNYFENVHFAGMGSSAASMAATLVTGRSLTLTGASENLFVNCVIGLDTVTRTAANCELEFIAGATACARNVFVGCKFLSYSGTVTTHVMIKAAASTVDRFAHFDSCKFINAGSFSGGTTDAQVANWASTAGGALSIEAPHMVGVTALQTSSSGNVYVSGVVSTFATAGLAVAS